MPSTGLNSPHGRELGPVAFPHRASAAELPHRVAQKFVEQFNMEILTSSPEEFAAYQKSEQERWFKVIKDNDIKGD